MVTNLLKKYNEHLELLHLNDKQRVSSLRDIFDRDIANNNNFKFRSKIIRPLKKEGIIDVESLFDHLIKKSVDIKDDKGRSIGKSRSEFDINRSVRLHWIWHHIQEKESSLKIFSVKDRKDGRDVLRTYILNKDEKYLIVLEPQRSLQDYYLLSAHYLDEKNGLKKIMNKWRRKLDEVY